VCKSHAYRPFTSTQTMRDPNFIDEQRNADLLDAMADRDQELREAMQETDPQEWELYDDQA
jgi:hypothetical protein